MGRTINEIIIHCADTPPNWKSGRPLAEKIAEIKSWHLARGFSDVGYHWIIDRTGEIGRGRPESTMGAHVQGRNSRSIGICLLGGKGSTERDLFHQHFTPMQQCYLTLLISQIRKRHQITHISGHNEYSQKACPGFRVEGWLKSIGLSTSWEVL